MKLSLTQFMVTALCGATAASAAFVPSPALGVAPARSSRPDTLVMGYLDDLSDELNAPNPNPNPEEESHAANRMKDSDKDRYGPGNWDGFVDFDEFDGGDGQMGVAGDGNTGLEKIDNVPMMASSTQNFDKSKMMSAKNAWGSSTGYADELLTKNPKMDVSRAQQLENWQSQQEVRRKTQQQQNMAEQYGQSSWDEEENYRNLASFGVERNQVRYRVSVRAFFIVVSVNVNNEFAPLPQSIRELTSVIRPSHFHRNSTSTRRLAQSLPATSRAPLKLRPIWDRGTL